LLKINLNVALLVGAYQNSIIIIIYSGQRIVRIHSRNSTHEILLWGEVEDGIMFGEDSHEQA